MTGRAVLSLNYRLSNDHMHAVTAMMSQITAISKDDRYQSTFDGTTCTLFGSPQEPREEAYTVNLTGTTPNCLMYTEDMGKTCIGVVIGTLPTFHTYVIVVHR